MSFSPRDSLSLYDALIKQAGGKVNSLPESIRKELSALHPDSYFSQLLINKASAMEYERKLKGILTTLLSAGLVTEVNAVMTNLTGDLRERIARMEGLTALGRTSYDYGFHPQALLLAAARVACARPAACDRFLERQ